MKTTNQVLSIAIAVVTIGMLSFLVLFVAAPALSTSGLTGLVARRHANAASR